MSIPRPARTRRKRQVTLADAVDRLLLMDEINPGETRAVSRAIKAVQTAIDNFSSYSSAGFRYYNARYGFDLGATFTIGDCTVASNVLTPDDALTYPSWILYGHVKINNELYPVRSVSGQDITLDGTIADDDYTGVNLQQIMVPIPDDFRRRGSITDKENYFPVEDVTGGALQTWSDYWDWGQTSSGQRTFGALTGDQRYSDGLMLMVWPPAETVTRLNMFYERYPAQANIHRAGTGTVTVSGTTATASTATFTADMVGSAIMFSTDGAEEIRSPLASPNLENGQRIITAYTSTTVVTLDVTASITDKTFYVSDLIDAMPGPMTEAILRLAEHEILRQSRGQSGRLANRFAEFHSQLLLAMADDVRYMPNMDDGPYAGFDLGQVTVRPA